MTVTINFDDEFVGSAVKVYDERSDGMLAPEFEVT